MTRGVGCFAAPFLMLGADLDEAGLADQAQRGVLRGLMQVRKRVMPCPPWAAASVLTDTM